MNTKYILGFMLACWLGLFPLPRALGDEAIDKEFEFADAAPMLWEMRMIKSPRELDWIRRAKTITTQGYVEGFPLVREGMTEREIASILTMKLVEHGAEQFWIMVTSGEGNYRRISGKPTDRRVRRGDMV